MLVRLSKLMSERGLCSRREADAYIERGEVMVDGQIISVLGTRVAPDASIRLLPAARKVQQKKVTIILNKPVGIVSNLPEKDYTAAIELILEERLYDPQREHQFKPYHKSKLAVAGRLDIDSKGLLVFTQDGTIAKLLIGADSPIEKEYYVCVEGGVTPAILEKLRFGLSLDGKPLKRAEIEQIKPYLLRFVLREGKKRQIRRMCELVGLEVTSLKRVRIGNITLGDLPEGQWRYLESHESF